MASKNIKTKKSSFKCRSLNNPLHLSMTFIPVYFFFLSTTTLLNQIIIATETEPTQKQNLILFLFQPKVDWRTQHENFVKAIRYAKGVSNEPPPPTENPDYVQCPHCERKFNPATAERHIPKCKDIKAKPARLKKKR